MRFCEAFHSRCRVLGALVDALKAPANRFKGLNLYSLANSVSLLTCPISGQPCPICQLPDSPQEPTLLTSSSHLPHPSILLRYCAFLLALLIANHYLNHGLNRNQAFVRPPPYKPFFPSFWLHRSSGLHQRNSRLPTHSQLSIFLRIPLAMTSLLYSDVRSHSIE